MDIGVISVRYARALLKSATDQQLEATVYKEMMTVAKSYLTDSCRAKSLRTNKKFHPTCTA